MADVNVTTPPPTRAAAQSPVVLVLESNAVDTPDFARMTLDVSQIATAGAGATITINDITFTAIDILAGPLDYTDFLAPVGVITIDVSGASFVYAFLDTPLANDYRASYDSGTQLVTISAIATGPAYNLTVDTSTPDIHPAVTNAPVEYELQQPYKARPGIYCDVYVWPTDADRDYPNAPADYSAAIRLPRVELPYSAGNAYSFDLAPLLRQYLSRAQSVLAYAVKYGEIYATGSVPHRFTYPAGTWPPSNVAWAFDAVDAAPLYSDFTDPNEPRWLTPAPGVVRPLWIGPAGNDYPVMLPLSRIVFAGDWQYVAQVRLFDGTTTDVPLAGLASAGGIAAVTPLLWETYSIGDPTTPQIVEQIAVAPLDNDGATAGGAVVYARTEWGAPGAGEWLVFLNRLGGLESWGFPGTVLSGRSATRSTYQPSDGTTRTGRVDLTQTLRLYSGPISADAYDFLCAELGTSPEVQRAGAGGFSDLTPVRITDFDPKPDPVNGLYSIEVEVTAVEPFIPLSAS